MVKGKLVLLWVTPLLSNSLLEIKREEKGGGTFREVTWPSQANHSTERLWVQWARGKAAHAQRRWPWFELQEIRSWELAIMNSQPVNPFRANDKRPARKLLYRVTGNASRDLCGITPESLQPSDKGCKTKQKKSPRTLGHYCLRWLHDSWIALNEWTVCRCTSRVQEAGSWHV